MLSYTYYDSPIGRIYSVIGVFGVEKVILFEEEWTSFFLLNPALEKDDHVGDQVNKQLEEYFCGKRKEFTVPMCISGTPFRKSVWNAIATISYGDVKSYKNIGEQINNVKAVRAIGQACKVNPVPILIPCHRVLGKNGDMVGYAGDKISTKIELLALENKFKEST